MTSTYTSDWYISAPVQKVWQALVDPEIVSLYYLAPLSVIEKKIQGRISYGANGRAVIDGTILEYTEGETLGHTFYFVDAEGTPGPSTTVTYHLSAIGEEVTLLQLRHSGFEQSNESQFADISGGWPVILSSLKTLLETGRPIVWPGGKGH